MPVEIREIMVKAQIDSPAVNKENKISAEQLSQLKEEIIEECLDRLSQNLKKQQDR